MTGHIKGYVNGIIEGEFSGVIDGEMGAVVRAKDTVEQIGQDGRQEALRELPVSGEEVAQARPDGETGGDDADDGEGSGGFQAEEASGGESLGGLQAQEASGGAEGAAEKEGQEVANHEA